jgi:lysophospholipase L1-like esterase
VEASYRFYIENVDRIVSALRSANPNVRVAMSTLVGRWPGSAEHYAAEHGAVPWMKQRRLTPRQAAETLQRFNNLIREYAGSRNLVLIDAEEAFGGLDRDQLLWEFAHMTAEGYELLAEVMYDGLLSAGIVRGQTSPRRAELVHKYRAPRLWDSESA